MANKFTVFSQFSMLVINSRMVQGRDNSLATAFGRAISLGATALGCAMVRREESGLWIRPPQHRKSGAQRFVNAKLPFARLFAQKRNA
jgi:hypothetical protein